MRKARARFRDRDGVTREVKAVAATEAKAKAKLRGALKDRRRGPAGTDDELTPESTVEDLLVPTTPAPCYPRRAR